MYKLNLPPHEFKFRNKEERVEIYDTIRKKYIMLTPEEWVRQNFIRYLIGHKGFPPSLMKLEKTLSYNKMDKRCDILVYNQHAKPIVLIECKSPHIPISQETLNQIAIYNYALRVNFLIVTNGLTHYCCLMNYADNSYTFIENIPLFKELTYFKIQ